MTHPAVSGRRRWAPAGPARSPARSAGSHSTPAAANSSGRRPTNPRYCRASQPCARPPDSAAAPRALLCSLRTPPPQQRMRRNARAPLPALPLPALLISPPHMPTPFIRSLPFAPPRRLPHPLPTNEAPPCRAPLPTPLAPAAFRPSVAFFRLHPSPFAHPPGLKPPISLLQQQHMLIRVPTSRRPCCPAARGRRGRLPVLPGARPLAALPADAAGRAANNCHRRQRRQQGGGLAPARPLRHRPPVPLRPSNDSMHTSPPLLALKASTPAVSGPPKSFRY